jgi:hypothetical protein
MKMNKLSKTAILTLVLISSAVFFTGCQDVIYAKIMNEVTLDDATISGSVNSIVRFGDNIYIENGNVYYKAASSSSHETWNECMNGLTSVSYDYYGKAFSGTQIIKLAADNSYLYALGITYTEDEDEGENVAEAEYLYYYDGSTWTQIQSVTAGAATIFCTNTPNPDYRKAYLRTSSGVFLLGGSTVGSTAADSSTSACSAIYNYSDSSVYFFDEWATGCNATTTTTSSDTVYYYYASGDNLYYSTDASSFSSYYDLDMTSIISMAVTSNAILLGTNGSGLYKVSNSDGIPGSSTEDFDTNADSALGSPYRILAMLSVDPSDTETGATLYASADFSGTTSSTTGDYDDVGLWSYYPERGNWNRE